MNSQPCVGISPDDDDVNTFVPNIRRECWERVACLFVLVRIRFRRVYVARACWFINWSSFNSVHFGTNTHTHTLRRTSTASTHTRTQIPAHQHSKSIKSSHHVRTLNSPKSFARTRKNRYQLDTRRISVVQPVEHVVCTFILHFRSCGARRAHVEFRQCVVDVDALKPLCVVSIAAALLQFQRVSTQWSGVKQVLFRMRCERVFFFCSLVLACCCCLEGIWVGILMGSQCLIGTAKVSLGWFALFCVLCFVSLMVRTCTHTRTFSLHGTPRPPDVISFVWANTHSGPADGKNKCAFFVRNRAFCVFIFGALSADSDEPMIPMKSFRNMSTSKIPRWNFCMNVVWDFYIGHYHPNIQIINWILYPVQSHRLY